MILISLQSVYDINKNNTGFFSKYPTAKIVVIRPSINILNLTLKISLFNSKLMITNNNKEDVMEVLIRAYNLKSEDSLSHIYYGVLYFKNYI